MSRSVVILNRDDILEDLAAGLRLNDIAPKYNITPQAISFQLVGDPQYNEAIAHGFSNRLDQAEDAILSASDQLEVTRARTYWQALSWRAEREARGKYGANTQVSVSIDIGSALQAMSERLQARVLEHEKPIAEE